jgi:radical SAM-linked protein
MIEGIMSRGDERVGEWIESAFKSGARLDAWTEYFDKTIWKTIFERHEKEVQSILGAKNENEVLPWDVIDSKVSHIYISKERSDTKNREITSQCIKNCTHSCGICDFLEQKVVRNTENTSLCMINDTQQSKELTLTSRENNTTQGELSGLPCDKKHTLLSNIEKDVYRMLFSYQKTKRAIYLSHLNLVSVFQMAFQRAGFDVLFSSGFNPMPLLDFASPLALGIKGEGEIATVDFPSFIEKALFVEKLNSCLPEDLKITDALCALIPAGKKKHSPASLYWGAVYSSKDGEKIVPFNEEKAFKLEAIAHGGLQTLTRKKLLAKSLSPDADSVDYFSIYKRLYADF